MLDWLASFVPGVITGDWLVAGGGVAARRWIPGIQAGCEEARAQLTAAGIEFRESDHKVAWSIYLLDPDAHLIEITTYEPTRLIQLAMLARAGVVPMAVPAGFVPTLPFTLTARN